MFSLDAWLRRRALVRSAIDDTAWQQALGRCRLVAHLDAPARARLREMVTLFLDAKPINAADGFELTASMRLAIAVQACVPILELGLESYAHWVEVIVYPDEFIVEREQVDEAGVVHATREPLSGESWSDGPVILSWADIEASGPDDGYNVVVHEFAHKLDMLDGDADGIPPLHAGMSRDRWCLAFSDAYEDLVDRVEQREKLERQARRSRVHSARTDSLRLDADWADLPLDPYACTDPAEFFACASEVFFETPARLNLAYPAVYGQMVLFYRQDPLGAGEPGASAR